MTPEFVELVRRMRESQQRYFQLRTPTALETAKRLELKVDRALKTFADGATQSGLFEAQEEQAHGHQN